MSRLATLAGIPLARAIDHSSGQKLQELSRNLSRFYANNADYYAQAEESDHSRYYEVLFPLLLEMRARSPERKIRVLEIGAGKTALPAWLQQRGARHWIELIAQDVSEANREWLAERVDETYFGDAANGIPGGPYDLIFCTFVYEHLVRPDLFLDNCDVALGPGGILIIFSPRYDMPGYIPPALRWLPWQKQVLWNLCLVLRRVNTAINKTPTFWIMTDPAVLNGPYFRDADAVHLVSRRDLRLATQGRGKRLPIRLPPRNFRDWIWSRGLLLSEGYQKAQ